MPISPFGSHAIKQIAYVVPDVRLAAARHSQIFGSGPFFLGHNTLSPHFYRDLPWELDMDAALGQCGDIQIELIQMNGGRRTIFHEVLPGGGPLTRPHHICLHPANIAASIADFERLGYPLVFDFTLPAGTRAVMIDTLADLGHFIEMYERTPEIEGLYDAIKSASANFDGSDLIRPMAALMA